MTAAAVTLAVAFASVTGVVDGFTAVPSVLHSGVGNRATSRSPSSSYVFDNVRVNTANKSGRRRRLTRMVASAPTTEATDLDYDLKSWAQGYETTTSEDQYVMEPSVGTIPKDIEGTWYRNGPHKFKIGGEEVKHPFDGDGMIMAISFSPEGAYFRNRFVKTKGYKKELKANKQLYRGFGNLPGGPLKNAFRIGRKNLANTNVHFWGGNLLALWEAGLPHRLDAKSLETLGETNLGSTIDEKRPIFTAHPRIDPKNKRFIGFGSHNIQEVRIYEYDKDFRLIKTRLAKEVKGLIHDFAVTNTHYIFYGAPTALNPLKWVLGLDNLGSAIKWDGDERDAMLYAVPRDINKDVKTITIPAGFSFHLANAYDDPKTGEVVVDIVETPSLILDTDKDPSLPLWDTFDFRTDMSPGSLYRYRLDVSSKDGSLVNQSLVYGKSLDFPTIHPRVSCQEYRYIWAACGRSEGKEACPVQGVVKIDLLEGTSERWLPEPHEFLGEATFVPRTGAGADSPEDDGYLVAPLVNGRDQLTDIVILNAAEVTKGPICRLPLKSFVGHSLHGTFSSELVHTPEQVEKSFALTDLFSRKGWNVAKSEFSGLGLNSVLDG